MREKENLTILGGKAEYRFDYDPDILETFSNKHPGNDYFVKFNCPEFTTLCPITGQPDFAALTISYVRDIRTGEKILFQTEDQLEALCAVLEELELQGALSAMSELNMYDLENIYLVTLDGYTANIGTAEDARAKIGTVRAVVEELRRRGLRGGIIEATVPGQATYRPLEQ